MAKRRSPQDRRRDIAKAAGALFAEQGVRGTTVRDIAEAVGILSGSLYHHFKTKNDIVHELMQRYGQDLVARYERAAAPGGPSIESSAGYFSRASKPTSSTPTRRRS